MCDGTRFPHFIERYLYQRLRIIPPITHTPETDAPDLIACVQYDPAIARHYDMCHLLHIHGIGQDICLLLQPLHITMRTHSLR